jgi:hypothetical protein
VTIGKTALRSSIFIALKQRKIPKRGKRRSLRDKRPMRRNGRRKNKKKERRK